MKNLTCVWRNIYNTARAIHSRYYKHFAKHSCDFSLILLEPCNFLYKYGCLFYMLEMLIARHLGTPNSVFLLANECVIQYYTDQRYAALGR